ncbi:MAG: hypothetical protein R2685_12045 [Candidatus Nitrosocosmicus sp.]|nr:hypothetical protein [Candidatus Nitrosocosmicus sp.]
MDKIEQNISPEKIAFIAYNIGVYETVQKFGGSIAKGKISSNMDVSKIAEVLSESHAFYDSELISQIINTMVRTNKESALLINRVSKEDVDEVLQQLKTCGISLPGKK